MLPKIALIGLFLLSTSSALSPPEPHLRPFNAHPDYDAYSFESSDDSELKWYDDSGTIKSTGRSYTAHIATFNPSFFSFLPPMSEGCVEYIKTSISSNSSNWNCDYATNGGFFIMGADEYDQNLCEGTLVSDGKEIVMEGYDYASFGVTSDATVVTGYLDKQVYDSLHFTHLMSGRGWLVRNGEMFVANSQDLSITSNFVVEKAPRTAVGVFDNGTMLLYVVDGEEDINEGPDLFEMAELMADLGVASAVNIDGGGSTVAVQGGNVVSVPTCKDTPEVCEREVQSIACVRHVK